MQFQKIIMMFPSSLMSEKVLVNCTYRVILNRGFAAAAPQSKLQQSSTASEQNLKLPDPIGLKCARLPSGLQLATLDNNNPVARISLVFKAGSRFETYENRGVVHRLRNLIGLSTSKRTAIDFNYHAANVGALLTSSSTRDHLSFDISIYRRNVGEAFRILDELMSEPFHVAQHDLIASTPQMLRELNILKENWPAYCLENLHKAAYRNQGLSHPVLSPKRYIGGHKAEQVLQFANKHLTTGNAVLAATGVDHDDVTAWANGFFPLAKGGATVGSAAGEKVQFLGGEIRKQRPIGAGDLVVAYIGAASTGALNDPKSAVTHAVLANVLGTGPLLKWSTNGGQNRLAKAVGKVASNPFHVSASNIGYDGTGMFTLFYTSQWEESGAVAKAALGELRAVAGQGVKEQELQAAKNRLKHRLLSLAENDDYVVEDLAIQAAVRQSDIALASDQVKLVDAVTAGDVQQAAKTIVGGKLAMASIGQLSKTPYVDEL